MKLQLAKNPQAVSKWAAQFEANPETSAKNGQEFSWKIKFGEASNNNSNWNKYFSQLKKQEMLFFYQPDAPDYKIVPANSVIDQTGFETQDFEAGLETDITESDHQHTK